MDENLVLRELTNLPINNIKLQDKKDVVEEPVPQILKQYVKPSMDQLITISQKQIDFGFCLPGSIHQKTFTISVKSDLPEVYDLVLCILFEDQVLYDSQSLIFGVKRANQQQFYDDYRMKVKAKNEYEFKIGVKTPMVYEYDVKSVLYVHFSDYSPVPIILKQKIQIPEVVCAKELFIEEDRVIKLSVIQNRGKRQCRVPFKLNHNMNISVNAEIVGLFEQFYPLIDVKPKAMTLTGKGQFSLLFSMNFDDEIRQTLLNGLPKVVRKILTLKIRETKFIYHFPVQVTYYPEPKKNIQVIGQQF